MHVTVCQMHDAPEAFAADWTALCRHVAQERSALVLLPEMPFAAWFATAREFERPQWDAAMEAHRAWRARLAELAPAVVLSTEPVEHRGRRLNEAFVWAGGEAAPAHHKRYLPEEDGFWEPSWYERGDGAFVLSEAGDARVGFQICTELWTLEEARKYGLAGADVVAARPGRRRRRRGSAGWWRDARRRFLRAHIACRPIAVARARRAGSSLPGWVGSSILTARCWPKPPTRRRS